MPKWNLWKKPHKNRLESLMNEFTLWKKEKKRKKQVFASLATLGLSGSIEI